MCFRSDSKFRKIYITMLHLPSILKGEQVLIQNKI